MAGRDPLNSFTDLAALQAEADRVIAIVRSVDEAVKNVGQITSLYKGSSGNAELKKNTEELAKANQDLLNSQKQLDAENQKQITAQGEVAKQIAKVKIAKKELTDDELRDAVKTKQLAKERLDGIKAEESAYKQLQNEYTKASAKAKDLGAQVVKSPNDPGLKVRAENASKEADALNNQLKAIDASMGEHRRKVGDYIGAISTLQPVLSEIKTRMDSLTRSGQGNSAEFASLREQYESLSVVVDQAKTGFTSLTMQIRSGEKALQTMRAANLDQTDAFKQLRVKVAEAHREFNEFNNQQRLLENHAPALKAMTLAAKGVGGAYALSAGAAALFGDEQGKIEKETQKLIAIMTVLQGLNEVAELLHQRTAIALAFETGATKIAEFAQKAWTSTMLQSTVATVGFRIALIGLTGGLLLLLPLAAFAFGKMSDSIKDTRMEEELLNEVNKKAIDGYAEETLKIQLATKELQSENISREDKRRLIDELQHKYPQYLGNIKNEGELTEDLATAIKDKLIPALELEAKAKAAQELATEKFKKLLELQNEQVEKLSSGGNLWDKTLDALNSTSGGLTLNNELMDHTANSAAEIKKEIEGLFKISLDANEQLQGLGGHITEHDIKSVFIDLTKEIEARAKLIELIKQQQIELTKSTSDNTNSPEFSRVNALSKAYELEKQIINSRLSTSLILNSIETKKLQDNLTEQLSNLKLTEKEKNEIRAQSLSNQRALEIERKAIVSQADDDLFKSELTYDINRAKIHADMLAQIVDDEKKTREELAALEKTQQDIVKAATDKRIAYIEEARDIEISALNKTYAEGKITEQQYQDQRKKLETDADVFILKARQDLLKLDIDKAKAEGKDPAILEAQYANLERQINDKKNAAKIESDKKVFEEKKKLKGEEIELEKKAAEQFGATVEAFVKGAYERQLNSLQKQIDANTKLKDTEITRINQSSLSEQDKAAKLTQINAQTQANNERLAARQKEIKLKEAKFERDTAILNVGIATGQAVAKTLLEAHVLAANPLTVALAPAAYAQVPIEIGIGAAQIAAILAKPLPRYATGTDYSPEGHAIVGEKGHELRIDPSGQISLTPDKPSLTYLQQGTKIIPHDEVNKMMLGMMIQNTAMLMLPKKQDEAAKEIRSMKQIIQWQHQELIQAWARIAEKNRPIIKKDYKDFGKDYI